MSAAQGWQPTLAGDLPAALKLAEWGALGTPGLQLAAVVRAAQAYRLVRDIDPDGDEWYALQVLLDGDGGA